jgi:Hemerythrin HHE cation binding domain
MSRMKTYDVPHKGLRNALSQLQLLAGKTDYSNPGEVEQLYQMGEDVFKILTIHAADENEVTLAELEQRCAGCSNHDIEDHEQIHLAQDNLEKLLAKIYANSKKGLETAADGEEFYLAFSEFHSTYLEHTAEEERITQPLLWKYFTDEELASHRGKIMAKNPPQTLLIWFKFVIPAQSHNERVGLFTGFKKMAPPAFFDEGMRTIKQVLAETDFDNLRKALGT